MGSNASSNLFSRVGPLGLLHLPALDLPPFLLPDRTAEQPDLLRLEPAACFESWAIQQLRNELCRIMDDPMDIEGNPDNHGCGFGILFQLSFSTRNITAFLAPLD